MGTRYFVYKISWDALRHEYDHDSTIRGIGPNTTAECRGILARTLTRYRFVRDFVDSEIPPTPAGCGLLWICASPPNDTGFDVLRKRVEKFLSFAKITRYSGIYEQRAEWPEPEHGSIPEPFGFHTHILLEYSNTSQSMTRRVRNSFLGWNVDIQYCPEKFVQDKLRYMLGEKDAEKARKVRMDVYWRMQKSIPDGFSKDPWALDEGEPERPEEGDLDSAVEVCSVDEVHS